MGPVAGMAFAMEVHPEKPGSLDWGRKQANVCIIGIGTLGVFHTATIPDRTARRKPHVAQCPTEAIGMDDARFLDAMNRSYRNAVTRAAEQIMERAKSYEVIGGNYEVIYPNGETFIAPPGHVPTCTVCGEPTIPSYYFDPRSNGPDPVQGRICLNCSPQRRTP